MKKLIGRPFAFILAIGLCLAAVSCAPKAENKIVGKWAQGTNIVITFGKDGKMTSLELGATESGGYWVTNGNILCVNVKGEKGTVQFNMSFKSDNELDLTMLVPADQNKSEHFTRVVE
jgi:hypothetical protein